MSVRADLERLSAAEEFFAYLEVPFDADVLSVARLHILRRLGDLLREEPQSTGVDEDEALRARFRDHLATAYAELVERGPLEQRLFKVHRDAVAPKPTEKRAAFVSLSDLAVGSPSSSPLPIEAHEPSE